MIMGRSGSGKSTFAYQLQQKMKLPLHHLDKYFFTDFWVERDYQQFLDIQQSLVAQEQWIIDGNAIQSFEMRYKCAQICIYFNFPKYLCFWRVFRRFCFKDKRIDDRPENCPETISWSLIKYMWNFEHRVAPILSRLKSDYPKVCFVEVCSDRDLKHIDKLLGLKRQQRITEFD
nr:DNA topology modulation protein [Legionella jordanis]